jgi:hypothetical protein
MSDWTRVVVGIDGPDSSKSALRWPADEAKAQDAALTVASVWTPHLGDDRRLTGRPAHPSHARRSRCGPPLELQASRA